MSQFVKVAGCEGFHCYEVELLGRLQTLGIDLLGMYMAAASSALKQSGVARQLCFHLLARSCADPSLQNTSS